MWVCSEGIVIYVVIISSTFSSRLIVAHVFPYIMWYTNTKELTYPQAALLVGPVNPLGTEHPPLFLNVNGPRTTPLSRPLLLDFYNDPLYCLSRRSFINFIIGRVCH